MTVAPRFLASMTHWKPTGCASAKLEPSMMTRSALAMSCRDRVEPPRPKEPVSTGTVAEWQIRAWFSTWMTPEAVYSFFMR